MILFQLTFSCPVSYWTSNVVDKSIQEFCGQWPSWSASSSVSVGICVCPHLSLPFLLSISLHAAVGLPKRPGLKREHLLYYNTLRKWQYWGVEGLRERENEWGRSIDDRWMDARITTLACLTVLQIVNLMERVSRALESDKIWLDDMLSKLQTFSKTLS